MLAPHRLGLAPALGLRAGSDSADMAGRRYFEGDDDVVIKPVS
jgi:hypothetical protein